MNVKDKIIIVTGGARGIGRALCERFINEKAGAVVVSDIDENGAKNVASQWGGHAFKTDVSIESDIISLVNETEKLYGRVDLFCSNAGIGCRDLPGGYATSCSNDIWQKSWEVHVMAHVYAARAALPRMIKRGEGYFLNVSSAAGLLNQIGSAAYSTTKHAAIGFAEALAITHGDDGIRVSVVCPQAVKTDMLPQDVENPQDLDGILTPEEVAESVIRGLAEESFLILPHETVKIYMSRKASDYDRWIKGMRRFRQKVINKNM